MEPLTASWPTVEQTSHWSHHSVIPPFNHCPSLRQIAPIGNHFWKTTNNTVIHCLKSDRYKNVITDEKFRQIILLLYCILSITVYVYDPKRLSGERLLTTTTVILGKATLPPNLPEVEGGGGGGGSRKKLFIPFVPPSSLLLAVHFSRVVVIASSPKQRHSLTLHPVCVLVCMWRVYTCI